MSKFTLVDVKDIQSEVPRSNFSEAVLDQLADAILASDGVIRPVVLKPTGIDSYAILDGHLEYYAAVRAKEKNPKQGELVNAFVVPPKLIAQVSEQIQLIEGDPINPPVTDDTRLNNFELRFEKYVNQSRQERAEEQRATEARLKQLEKDPGKINPLELMNTLSISELVLKLKRSRIPKAKAEGLAQAICDIRKKLPDEKFDSYSDVVQSVKESGFKGLGDKTMLGIIDDWSKA